eukprot:1616308-Rhodomonas_salina.1
MYPGTRGRPSLRAKRSLFGLPPGTEAYRNIEVEDSPNVHTRVHVYTDHTAMLPFEYPGTRVPGYYDRRHVLTKDRDNVKGS